MRNVAACRELGGCLIAQRAVRSLGIVFAPPGLQDHLGLTKRTKYLTVQEFVTQLVVKALNVSLLPG